MKISDSSEFATFDIETTGLSHQDVVTTVVVHYKEKYVVWLNDGVSDVDRLESGLAEYFGEEFQVRLADSERDLLVRLNNFVDEYFDGKTVLVAYNGETWQGGFDLGFLRTSCVQHGLDFPFSNVPYFDLYPIFRKQRFFTSEYDEEEDEYVDQKDLVSVHRILCESGTTDKIEDSSKAVEFYENKEYVNLMLHCAEDVRKTRELLELATEYVSVDDLKIKQL